MPAWDRSSQDHRNQKDDREAHEGERGRSETLANMREIDPERGKCLELS